MSSSAQTQQLPRLPEQPCEDFQAGQSRILQMIAANKPLGETLSSLVKLIEAQSPDMLCSVVLLSDDGTTSTPVREQSAPYFSAVFA